MPYDPETDRATTLQYQIATPLSKPAHSAEEAFKVANEWGNPSLVIKAQVLAGGRGKGHFKGEGGLKGGVHMVDSYVILSPSITVILTLDTIPQSDSSEGFRKANDWTVTRYQANWRERSSL